MCPRRGTYGAHPVSSAAWKRPSWWGKRVLSSPEAADYLGYTTRTLRNWRRAGYGPKYFRPDAKTGAISFRIEDLDEFMRSTPPRKLNDPPKEAA